MSEDEPSSPSKQLPQWNVGGGASAIMRAIRTRRSHQHSHPHRAAHDHDSGTDENDMSTTSEEDAAVSSMAEGGSGGAVSVTAGHRDRRSRRRRSFSDAAEDSRGVRPGYEVLRQRSYESSQGRVTQASRRPAAASRTASTGGYSSSGGGTGAGAGGVGTPERYPYGSYIGNGNGGTHGLLLPHHSHGVQFPHGRPGHHFGSRQHPLHSHGWGRAPPNRWSRRRWAKTGRVCAAICVICYVLLIIRSTLLLPSGGTRHPGLLPPLGRDNHIIGVVDDRETPDIGFSRAEGTARWRAEKIHLAETSTRDNASKRRMRTRPPVPPPLSSSPSFDSYHHHLRPYEFALRHEDRRSMPPTNDMRWVAPPLLSAAERVTTDSTDSDLATPATIDQLCGVHARNASLSHPISYQSRDALNSNSRVLITGILNPIGFHLALALKERCGVNVVMGIDPMFPNTVLNRLELQNQIRILTNTIPKFVQPILVPYVGLDPRLNPNKKSSSTKQPLTLPVTGELNFLHFRPTHIVHLASAFPETYLNDHAIGERGHNDQSPYVTESRKSPPLYQIRQSLAGMEHLLSSISSSDTNTVGGSVAADGGGGGGGGESSRSRGRPHFLYASSHDVLKFSSPSLTSYYTTVNAQGEKSSITTSEAFHGPTKLVDEVLAQTYHALDGVYSVGLRLPRGVYGPWGIRGSPLYELAETASKVWNYKEGKDEKDNGDAESEEYAAEIAEGRNKMDPEQNFIFVDDVVDALIAAMQYRQEKSSPAVFSIGSGDVSSLPAVAGILQEYMNGGSTAFAERVSGDSTSSGLSDLSVERNWEYLHWSPETSLHSGLTKLMAWHLDKARPFGNPIYPVPMSKVKSNLGVAHRDQADKRQAIYETGNELLVRQGAPSCSPDDRECLRGASVFPCSSECSSAMTCMPSIYDEVAELMNDITEDCDVVLYTSSLGRDMGDIKLTATFVDEGERIICNFAFVPRDSRLVSSIVDNVPRSQLERFGVDTENDDTDEKLSKMNGRLLYKGWILVWVADAITPLSPVEESLLKLSPGKLFASSVRRAMFVDEKFPVTPNNDDVMFLVDETHRDSLRRRSVYRKEEDGKKHKYILPAEPERRAVLLASPLKRKKSNDKGETPPAKGHKISVYEATKYMIFEMGGDPSSKEPVSLKKQREFYERVPTFVNREDMRSIYEPVYRYEMKHWIRSRWIVHDMELEEGRLLRCEWYKEHTSWGNELDQLSFAHIMAKKELERKFAREEPDDHMRAGLSKHPELEELTDMHEWHAILNGKESAHDVDVISELIRVPDHMASKDEKEDDQESVDTERIETESDSVPLFVRIMSDRVMLISRKVWAEKMRRKKNTKEKRRRGNLHEVGSS